MPDTKEPHGNHEYVLDVDGRGKCKYCSREVQFPPGGKGEVTVIQEGWAHLPKSPDDYRTKLPLDTEKTPKGKHKIMKMTKELKNRLLEVGPQQFCDEYGYTSRAMGRFVQMYRRLGGVWPKLDEKSDSQVVKRTKKERTAQSLKSVFAISTKGGNHIKIVIELTIGQE